MNPLQSSLTAPKPNPLASSINLTSKSILVLATSHNKDSATLLQISSSLTCLHAGLIMAPAVHSNSLRQERQSGASALAWHKVQASVWLMVLEAVMLSAPSRSHRVALSGVPTAALKVLRLEFRWAGPPAMARSRRERLALSPQLCQRGTELGRCPTRMLTWPVLGSGLRSGSGRIGGVGRCSQVTLLPGATMKKMRSHMFLRGVLQVEASPS